ncbi:putative quinol monooxygenase [Mycoplasmopsis gallinarum]|uniref:putative quinol monooxygenase n=1 Tax=Mycoplasmopsis gallinarum TaxID=29557 RepID=UPI000484585D|nr:hypothetical protein [Mycoplasmopsis gallinarum]
MIYVVLRQLKVKTETKKEFSIDIERWLKNNKKEELNLSLDAVWKDKDTMMIVERWSTPEAYQKFINSDQYKVDWENINQYLSQKPSILKFETIN